MENLLNKEPVQRVLKALSDFDESLKVETLSSSARTAKDAAESLKTEVGSIVKSLLLRRQSAFLLCLVAGDKRCSLNKVEIFIDDSLARFTNIFAAAGHPYSIFKINFDNLCKITNGSVKNISE